MEVTEYARKEANADLEGIMSKFPGADNNFAARMVLTAIDTFKESLGQLSKAEIERRFLLPQDKSAPTPVREVGQKYVNGQLNEDAAKLVMQSIFDQYKIVYRGYL